MAARPDAGRAAVRVENPDEVPARPAGRPVRGMADGFSRAGTRTDSARCRVCPRHDAKRTWCPLRAKIMLPDAPMCAYGTVLYRAAKQAKRRSERKQTCS